MCRTFEIAKNTVDEYVASKNPFDIEVISAEIVQRDGVHRVAPGFTVKDYLNYLEEKKIIVYDFSSMKYYNRDVLEKRRLELLSKT